jgi:hypothetical protein
MSRTESRRPLRVLSAEEIAQLQQQQQQAPRNAAQLAAAQSADRFRRTLAGPARRAEPTALASPSSAPAPGPAPASAPAMPAAAPQLLPRLVEEAQACDDEPAPVEPPAAAAIEPHQLAAAQEPPDDGPSAGMDTDGLAAASLAQDPWPQEMAETIANLCARAAPSFVNWTVTLPMDPLVLPETDLRLSLSQHWLSLRFITQSPQSHHLVCRYRQGLLEQLERLPNLPHGIDIEVT